MRQLQQHPPFPGCVHLHANSPQGEHSPPESPPLAAYAVSKEHQTRSSGSGPARRRGVAHTIAEECERLFCGTLKAVFLGEGNLAFEDSLVMDMQHDSRTEHIDGAYGLGHTARMKHGSTVGSWLEMWDYAGGALFRGFIANQRDHTSQTMFVFFDRNILGRDLKPG